MADRFEPGGFPLGCSPAADWGGWYRNPVLLGPAIVSLEVSLLLTGTLGLCFSFLDLFISMVIVIFDFVPLVSHPPRSPHRGCQYLAPGLPEGYRSGEFVFIARHQELGRHGCTVRSTYRQLLRHPLIPSAWPNTTVQICAAPPNLACDPLTGRLTISRVVASYRATVCGLNFGPKRACCLPRARNSVWLNPPGLRYPCLRRSTVQVVAQVGVAPAEIHLLSLGRV